MGSTQIKRDSKWQFSVRSLIFVTAFVSFMMAWLRWFGAEWGWWYTYYPGFYGICSVAVLLWAAFHSRTSAGCASVWNLVALAWYIVIFNLFHGIARTFRVVSGESPRALARSIQEGVDLSILSAITWPLFCTIPVLYVLVVRYRSRPQKMACWIYFVLALTFVDGVLFVILVSKTFGTWLL